jgi:EAL domain-containing protein (putative c-di-GMP-specific phosphodiesterase class I)
VDALKIDRSFVAGVGANADDRAIVESVIGLARSLGLDAVAEGVETVDQATLLADLDCSHAQGFHFAYPLTPDALSELLGARTLDELAG